MKRTVFFLCVHHRLFCRHLSHLSYGYAIGSFHLQPCSLIHDRAAPCMKIDVHSPFPFSRQPCHTLQRNGYAEHEELPTLKIYRAYSCFSIIAMGRNGIQLASEFVARGLYFVHHRLLMEDFPFRSIEKRKVLRNVIYRCT